MSSAQPKADFDRSSGRRGSNPRPSAWEADALPTELRPRSGPSVARTRLKERLRLKHVCGRASAARAPRPRPGRRCRRAATSSVTARAGKRARPTYQAASEKSESLPKPRPRPMREGEPTESVSPTSNRFRTSPRAPPRETRQTRQGYRLREESSRAQFLPRDYSKPPRLVGSTTEYHARPELRACQLLHQSLPF
jgi:hypothetical protein